MTHVNRKPRRYILVTSNSEITREAREWLTKRILVEYPALGKSEIVWYRSAFIVRTGLPFYEILRAVFSDLRHGEYVFKAARSSGTIINLKRLVKETAG